MSAQMGSNATDYQSRGQYDNEINLRELFGILLEGKVKIIAITVVFAVASVIYALSMPDQYKATALLAPANSDGGGISNALAEMGGLASLAGISLGGGETSDSQIAQEIMQSWGYIEGFIAENDIAVEVFAAEGWIRGSNELQIDDDLYKDDTETWLVKNNATGEVGPPSSWVLFKSFSKRLSVSEDKNSGLVSVSLEHYSPQVAKHWVDLYVESINRFMQQRQMTKVSRNIRYLQEQIGKTSNAEMRAVFYSIIEEQTKNKMLAEASPDYVFVVVGPSMLPEEKSQPKRALICILGTFLGGVLSSLLVLVMHYAIKSD